MNLTLKKFVLLVSFTFGFFIVKAQQSSTATPLEDMVNAIKNNRVSDMVKYFDNIVPITINNVQNVYSHNQAEVVLRDFFDKNVPKDVVVMDNGSPTKTSKFLIGNFTTAQGKYGLYLLMKMNSGVYLLQEIRLNKE
jgi:Domain of unknown function (DUF4783)